MMWMMFVGWDSSPAVNIVGCAASPATFIGGDSSPASMYESLLKQTHNESVSTDLHVLSRGFIPGGIMVCSIWEPFLLSDLQVVSGKSKS